MFHIIKQIGTKQIVVSEHTTLGDARTKLAQLVDSRITHLQFDPDGRRRFRKVRNVGIYHINNIPVN
jgi:hypothetical protein